MKNIYIIFGLFAFFLSGTKGYSQNTVDAKWGKGIGLIARDSSFSLKFGFRFQTLYDGRYYAENKNWQESFLIRRYRLKFDGYAHNPRIVYKMELGISNRDTGGGTDEVGSTANIILDAVVKYEFAPRWFLWVGQTKLPGNRERVISSQNLQFVDRSLVNSFFNLDRDMGFQLHTTRNLGNSVINGALAVSLGEGRGVIISNPDHGREFTARLEFLPFGQFASKGDYSGSDLAREKKPKLSIAATYDFNSHTPRSRGNLGSFLEDASANYIYSDLFTYFLDGVLKYKGLSWNAEFAHRTTQDPIAGFGYGKGFVTAIGYLFPSNYELALRYTEVSPLTSVSSIKAMKEYTLGLSKYVVGHSLKIQSDLSWVERATQENYLMFRIQCEVAL